MAGKGQGLPDSSKDNSCWRKAPQKEHPMPKSVWQGKGRGKNYFSFSSHCQLSYCLLQLEPVRKGFQQAHLQKSFPRVQSRAEEGRERICRGKLRKTSSFRVCIVNIYSGLVSVNWLFASRKKTRAFHFATISFIFFSSSFLWD